MTAAKTLRHLLAGNRALIAPAVFNPLCAKLAEAAGFGPFVDRFFSDVFVMVEDPALRQARLHLMASLSRLILRLADISEIVPQSES